MISDINSPPAITGRASRLSLFGGVAVAALAAGFLIVAVRVLEHFSVPPEVVLRDPASQVGFWPFYGFISNFGIFLLAASGSIALFVSIYGQLHRGLFAAIGLLSLTLAVDDLFLLHEDFWPSRGVPEMAVYVVYGVWGAATVIMNPRVFASCGAAAFWLAVALLASSMFVDMATTDLMRWLLLEDGLKFAGIATWAAWWITFAGASIDPARLPNVNGCFP